MTLSVLFAWFTGRAAETQTALLSALDDAVSLATGLLGLMAFWTGLMRILQAGGAMDAVARLLSPLLKRLFPKAFASPEARNAIASNIAANMLGLGNAATPLGLRAMRLIPDEKEAGLFVLCNTTGFCLLPTTIISLRAQGGAKNPGAVIPLIWLVSFLSVCFAILCGLLFTRRKK